MTDQTAYQTAEQTAERSVTKAIVTKVLCGSRHIASSQNEWVLTPGAAAGVGLALASRYESVAKHTKSANLPIAGNFFIVTVSIQSARNRQTHRNRGKDVSLRKNALNMSSSVLCAIQEIFALQLPAFEVSTIGIKRSPRGD